MKTNTDYKGSEEENGLKVDMDVFLLLGRFVKYSKWGNVALTFIS